MNIQKSGFFFFLSTGLVLLALVGPVALAGSASKSLQVKDSGFSYSGVVALYAQNPKQEWEVIGSATFIGPNTLITATHILQVFWNKKQDLVSLLKFANPHTGELEPITGYHSFSFQSDLSILKTKVSYPVFYPLKGPEVDPIPINLEARDKLVMVGFPQKDFKVIKGQFWNQYGYLSLAEVFYSGDLSGISGGAVFHAKTGQLIGMSIQGVRAGYHLRFISTNEVLKQLDRPKQDCPTVGDCLKEGIDGLMSMIFQGEGFEQHIAALILLNVSCAEEDCEILKEAAHILLKKSILQKWIPAHLDYCMRVVYEEPDVYSLKDIMLGLDLCEVAANKGDIMAMFILGILYYYGTDFIGKNPILSQYWFRKAVQYGSSAYALLHLGFMKLGDVGVKEDLSSALCLLSASNADLQYPEIALRIAELKSQGYVCPQTQ